MGDVERGKSRIQELLAASAEGLGVDTKNLVFKWDALEGMILPEHGLQLHDKVHILKVYLGRRSQAITFAEALVVKSVAQPNAFISDCKETIVATIRRLKRPEKKAGG